MGESKIDGVVSKLASLSTSMEMMFVGNIREAGTILSEKIGVRYSHLFVYHSYVYELLIKRLTYIVMFDHH